jgi:hypothetical protein
MAEHKEEVRKIGLGNLFMNILYHKFLFFVFARNGFHLIDFLIGESPMICMRFLHNQDMEWTSV